MKNSAIFAVVVMLVISNGVFAAYKIVGPGRTYTTIYAAVTAASSGDTIVVYPGTYYAPNANGIDFKNKRLTIISTDPNKPNQFVIDGQGINRLVYIHDANGSFSRLEGFTLTNGYKNGGYGANGPPPSRPGIRTDPCNAGSKDGNGQGGGIYIGANCNPTISKCVIQNCLVTGGRGGDGRAGVDGNDTETGGMSGGIGGNGSGNGFGGGIYVGSGAKPKISYCTIVNNTARGGVGGRGGNGGNGDLDEQGIATGQAGSGSQGGNGTGDGYGGGIYFDKGADPKIDNCTFSGNIASSGMSGEGGDLGLGVVSGTPPSHSGYVGASYGRGIGGGTYHNNASDPNYLTCTFNTNSATTAFNSSFLFPPYTPPSPLPPTTSYAGAVYVDGNNTDANFTSCTFNGNSPGAMRCLNHSKLHFTDCSFNSNIGASFGGGLETDARADVNMVGCSFGSNMVSSDGGAIYLTNGKLDATNCTFSANEAGGDGGGIYADSNNTIIMDNCALTGNKAAAGGGMWLSEFNLTLTSSYFVGNITEIGAGAFLSTSLSSFTITDSTFQNNSAKGTYTYGGGLLVSDCDGTIAHTKFMQNYSQGMLEGDVCVLYAEASGLTVTDCLLTSNSAVSNGGGAAVTVFSVVSFNNCTFAQDTANGVGGGIFCDDLSLGSVNNSIFASCSRYGIYEQSSGVISPITFNLFGAPDANDNQPADIYDGIADRTGATNINGVVSGASNNITGNPKFVMTGPLGTFYLDPTSLAVNAGSGTAASLGLNTRTTQTNNTLDSGTVNLGFHYPVSTSIALFNLKLGPTDGHGSITAGKDGAVDQNGDAGNPSGLDYYAGSIVPLTAVPVSGYRVKNWTGGTANDTAKTRTNTVLMVTNKTISVVFEQPATLRVDGQPGGYTDIQRAIDDAQDGDSVVVDGGTFKATSLYIDKSIILQSSRPDDPCYVIVDANGRGPVDQSHVQRCIAFGPGADENTIVKGFTFRNGWLSPGVIIDPTNPGDDGFDAPPYGNIPTLNHSETWKRVYMGGGIYCASGSKPRIFNCIIEDCAVRGGNGSNGQGATNTVNAGRGGWGGAGYGGGIYVEQGSSPVFQKCTITDCNSAGGNGGNGGNHAGPTANTTGNYGGLWSASHRMAFHYGSSAYVPGQLWAWWGYAGDYTIYTGMGGGVYCETGSSPVFEDCTISNNVTQGGLSGQGGTTTGIRQEPTSPFRLPSYGAGVFCQAGSNAVFKRCQFLNNSTYDGGTDLILNDLIGSGGGICAVGSDTTFEQCTFSGNDSATGGALYCSDANSALSDCNFFANTADAGAAIYATHKPSAPQVMLDMLNCRVTSNIASLPTGLGGGVVCDAIDASIADCNFMSNQAAVAGGGLYLSGTGGIMTVENGLFINNAAGRDGGGLSADFSAQPIISNCTFNGNTARGDAIFTGGYGGALSCLYGANVTLKNSILWGNTASSSLGKEIAVISGLAPDTQAHTAATINISYSDVRLGQANIYAEAGCTVNWQGGNLTGSVPFSDPLWVDGFRLSQTAAGQASTSPCVRNTNTSGSPAPGTAAQLPLGAYAYTTRTNSGNDTYDIDMGYHYRKGGEFLAGDINYDGVITWSDVALLITDQWLASDCGLPDYCGGADLNHDGIVNGFDEAILAQGYGVGDVNAPAPNPMTWAVAPYFSGTGTVSMRAAKAMDNSGGDVQYRIWQTATPTGTPVIVHNSKTDVDGWQTNDPCFVVTGLAAQTEYGFEVEARDTSHNRTVMSFKAWAAPGQDTSPPTNVTLSSSNITASGFRLTASGQDESLPITYEFTCTSGGGLNRAFGTSTFDVNGLANNTSYTYGVKAKDFLGNITSGYAASVTVTTSSSGGGGTDTTPPAWPAPSNPSIPLTAYWASFPAQSGNNQTMTCTTATDVSGPVEYQFVCVSSSSFSSGWQTATTYTALGIGIHRYTWEVQARDALGHTTSLAPTAYMMP